jgi:hypothetical protein
MGEYGGQGPEGQEPDQGSEGIPVEGAADGTDYSVPEAETTPATAEGSHASNQEQDADLSDVADSSGDRDPRRRGVVSRAAGKAGRVALKYVAIGTTVAVAAFALGKKIDSVLGAYVPEATHELDLEIGAPTSVIREDVVLQLGTVSSSFPLKVETSLDRPGPFNCDTTIINDGEEGDKITTKVGAGVAIERLTVTVPGVNAPDDESVRVEVFGDMRLSPTSQDPEISSPNLNGAAGSTDVCVGTGEMSKALDMANVAISGAGQVSAACAVDSSDGKEVLYGGVEDFVRNIYIDTEAAMGTPDGEGSVALGSRNIEVVWPEYDISAKELVDSSGKKLEASLGSVIDPYMEETDRHKDPDVNIADMVRCEAHTISVES